MSGDYADTVEAQMLADYVSEGKTIAWACRTLGIVRQTVYDRIDRSERFRDMMERARLVGYDAIADECFEIADETTFDTIETDKGLRPNKEWMARSKLRIETRTKLLAKWHPQKYGEKLEIESKSASVAIPTSDDPVAAMEAYKNLIDGTVNRR